MNHSGSNPLGNLSYAQYGTAVIMQSYDVSLNVEAISQALSELDRVIVLEN